MSQELHRDRNRQQLVAVESLHGAGAALVRDKSGIAYYAQLADLEPAEPAAPAEPEPPAAPAAAPAWPESPQRFDRWTDEAGNNWIFDQPRNEDGTYATDDPVTEPSESDLRWLPDPGAA